MMLLSPAALRHQVGGHPPEALALSFAKAATTQCSGSPVCSSGKRTGFSPSSGFQSQPCIYLTGDFGQVT